LKRRQISVDREIRLLIIAFLAFSVVVSLVSDTHQVKAEANQASSQLMEANGAVKKAFVAVLEAEQAGANVTGLLVRLNDGTSLLAEAEVAYRIGDASGAIDKAGAVLAIASEVETEAVSASYAGLTNRNNAFWSVAAVSGVAGFSFVLFMVLIWRWFKQNYIKKLRDSRPEVKGNEV